MNNTCEICNIRPASVNVIVSRNGRQQELSVCLRDYTLLKQQQYQSPLERMFGMGSSNGFFGNDDSDFADFSSRLGYPLPRAREGIDIDQFLSDNSKELIQQAGRIAHEAGGSQLDTQHLLSALITDPVATKILGQFKINLDDVVQYLGKHLAAGPKAKPETQAKQAELTVSPRVKNAVQASFQIAQELGHGYIGPEHLLAGLIAEDDGIAGELLRKYGITSESIRQKIVKVVGKGAQNGRLEEQSDTPIADQYSRDLTKMASEGKLDPVIGRADEIETTIEILSRRTKNNPVLIGEPGVGKTAIVEGLAQRIIQNDVPEILQNKRVLELNINALVAGSKYRGEFEERTKKLLEEITQHKEQLIVFIDELHTITKAGGSGEEGGLDISNVIKPALARGDLHLVGATTLNEYQKHIEKDAALERRFQPVLVGEPTLEQTIEILRGLRDRYETHHKVKINDAALVAAAELSDRYITNRFLPDKAIDLIDQAASRVRIGLTSKPEDIRKMDERIRHMQREQESATSHKDFDAAEKHKQSIKAAEEERSQAETQWRERIGKATAEVTSEHIAEVVSKITGVPVQDLTQEEREKLLNMEQKLEERVVGQSEAIGAIADAIRRSRSGLSDRKRPITTLLFLGPTGVGKTELAKAVAWNVFGDESALVRIDMSEYMERHAVARLIGAPPGYVGYEEGGQLTEAVRRRPYSVILLDEIEKAHPDVYNILLQVFDDGLLTDGKGRVVNFTNTIIIATSNLGSAVIQAELKSDGGQQDASIAKDKMMEIVRSHFRPEFINRLDEIIVFHPLSAVQVEAIAKLQLNRIVQTAKGQGIALEFSPEVISYISEQGYAPEFGARELKRKVQTLVETALAKELLQGNINEGDAVTAELKDNKIVFKKHDSKEPSEKLSK